MATTINKTDGTVLATVADGAIDTSTDITLIGRLYRNYGELVNENLAQMLENFAGTDAPANPLEGQIWYDRGDKQIKVYRSTGFVSLGISSRSASAPTNPVTADMWYDTTTAQLKLYTGASWIVVAPQYSTAQGKSGAVVESITDTLSQTHVTTIVYDAGTPVATFSKDADYTPNIAITGIPTVKKGITISSLTDLDFNGDLVGNVTGDVTGNADTADTWSTARTITLTGDVTGSVSIDGSSNVSLGTTSQLSVSGNGLTLTGTALASNAVSENTASTIVFRDSNGDFSANIMTGTATQARYADLAEKYTTDSEYPIGTAMCVGGDAETTASGNSSISIGVISENPAYLMNSESEGQAIGLKGRVPVRVIGAVTKGQAVYAWENGVCSTSATTTIVGVALESSDNTDEKLVECVLKV